MKHNNYYVNYNNIEDMEDAGKFERMRMEKPTKSHYSDTKTILDDFMIFVVIPKFDTLAELLRWRKEQINSRLA